MKTKVKLLSYSVLQNAISARIYCENPEVVLKEAKDEPRRVCLDDLFFKAKIRSVNLQRTGGSFILRTRRSRFLVAKFFELMGKELLDFSINPPVSGKLHYYLRKTAILLNESEGDLLYRLTSFKDKNGNEVEGKRTVEDVSESQKEIVIKKLREILRQQKITQPEIRNSEFQPALEGGLPCSSS